MNKGIQKAIEICGSQESLAKEVMASQTSVGNWLHGRPVSIKYVPLIVKATNGQVKAHEICPALADLMDVS